MKEQQTSNLLSLSITTEHSKLLSDICRLLTLKCNPFATAIGLFQENYSISCLLMLWCPESPGHQQPWYWLNTIYIWCFFHDVFLQQPIPSQIGDTSTCAFKSWWIIENVHISLFPENYSTHKWLIMNRTNISVTVSLRWIWSLPIIMDPKRNELLCFGSPLHWIWLIQARNSSYYDLMGKIVHTGSH